MRIVDVSELISDVYHQEGRWAKETIDDVKRG